MMRHSVHKIKLGSGQDASQMLARKLARNFLRSSRVTTTERRGKTLRSLMETLVTKAKRKSEATKNALLRDLADMEYVNVLVEQVAPALQNIPGGYIRIVRMNQRISDGASTVRVEWAHPVTIQWKKKVAPPAESKEKVKTPAKKQTKAK